LRQKAKITALLKTFLDANLPNTAKKRITLGVVDKSLAANIKQQLGIACDSTDVVFEFVRGLRRHATKLLRSSNVGDIEKAQLGLGHGYSRDKVRYNINRNDQMIIQAINLMDKLDKDINTFAMRIRYALLVFLTELKKKWFAGCVQHDWRYFPASSASFIHPIIINC
jgi:RNA processing factor Prp31